MRNLESKGRSSRQARKQRAKALVNGSISIFLTIMLLPIVTVATLYVEASRYQLAKSELAAASDLTLNARLAEYDTVLKDVYGLFAGSQNDSDKLSDELKGYFSSMIDDSGLSGADSEQVKALLAGIVDGNDASLANLLPMKMGEGSEGKPDFSLTGVQNSDYGNPQVLKNGIVEYCKYRTPVNAGLGVLEHIKAIKKVSKQSDLSSKNAKVSEKVADVSDKAADLYLECMDYLDAKAGYRHSDLDKYNGQYLGGVQTYSHGFATIVVIDYITCATAPTFPSRMDVLDVDQRSLSFSDDITNDDGAKLNGVKLGKTAQESLKHASRERKESALRTAWAPWNTKRFGSHDFERKYGTSVNLDEDHCTPQERNRFAEDLKEYLANVYRLAAVVNSCEFVPDGGDDADNPVSENDISQLKSILRAVKDYYQKAVIDFNDVVLRGASARVSVSLGYMKDEIDVKKRKLEAMKAHADEAKKIVGKLKSSVRAVTTENEKLQNAINDYGAEGDTFSAQMQAEHDGYAETLDIQLLEDFKQRIEGICTYLKRAIDYIDGLKFGGKALKDFSASHPDASIAWLDNCASPDGNNLKDYVKARCVTKKEPDQVTTVANEVTGSCLASKSMMPAEVGLDFNDNRFWQYLESTYEGLSRDNKGKGDEDSPASQDKTELIDSAKSMTDEATEKTEGATGDMSGYAGLPSKDYGERSFEVSAGSVKSDSGRGFGGMLEGMSSSINGLLSGIGNIATNARDHLYVTDYTFNMFSWYTQKKEMEQKAKEKGQPAGDISITSMSGATFENNVLHNAEVEYVIYGKKSATGNVAAAQASIFAIRFACNAVYAFTGPEIRNMTLTPALAIQSASLGVIPYKLPQIAMQLALALAESAIDMAKLNAGQSVALFKTKDTFVLGPSGVKQGAISGVKTIAQNGATNLITYGSEKIKGATSDLLDTAEDTANAKIDEIQGEVDAVAEEKASELVQGVFSAFEEKLSGSVGNIYALVDQGDAAIDRMVDDALANAQAYVNRNSSDMKGVLQDVLNTSLTEGANAIKAELKSKLGEIKNGAKVKVTSLQTMIADKLSAPIKNATDYAAGKAKGLVSTVRGNVESSINSAVDKGAEHAQQAAYKAIDAGFDKAFGSLDTSASSYGAGSTSNSIANALTLRYSDYLRIFLFVGLVAGDQAELLRIADLIQVNLNNGQKSPTTDRAHKLSGGGFSLSNAYTYYEITTNVGLKTTFFNIPGFTKQMGTEKRAYFPMSYHAALGY